MNLDRWRAFTQTLRLNCEGTSSTLATQMGQFTEFVGLIPQQERIPALLHAYDRYRELGSTCDADPFESSRYSILISTILNSKIQPDEPESLAILRKSYHQCGHGSDVDPPLALAERAFRNRPYSLALFDAVEVYKETLRPTRSISASNIKRKLNWILWHDPRRVEKKCCTRKIQNAIHAMDPPDAFAWQWLLRNAAAGLNCSPGKAWLKEGQKRLSQIGHEDFLRRIDDWFTFGQGETSLTPAGSAMMRLLVWYGGLLDLDRSLPILVRLAHVSWTKREPAQKVMSALAWLLRNSRRPGFDAEIGLICRDWSKDSAEAGRLQEANFPADAMTRQQSEREIMEQRKKDIDVQFTRLAETLSGMGLANLLLKRTVRIDTGSPASVAEAQAAQDLPK
jgi:hypothetical protein